MNFSHDGKYLAFIFTDGVDTKAGVYEWFNKSRILGQLDFPKTLLKKISFNPKDNHQVCLSGSGHWKLWRV
jgi:cilia- and flagella-associated protein 57